MSTTDVLVTINMHNIKPQSQYILSLAQEDFYNDNNNYINKNDNNDLSVSTSSLLVALLKWLLYMAITVFSIFKKSNFRDFYVALINTHFRHITSTYCTLNKMMDILQMAFWNAFSLIEVCVFYMIFTGVCLKKKNRHWFRQWLGIEQVTSH